MKKQNLLFPTISGLLLAIIALCFVFTDRVAFAQRARVVEKTGASSPAMNNGGASVNTSVSSRFAAAALTNRQLRNSMRWNFGGRVHSGWEIYVPLISQTIGTDAAPDSAEFAAALSKWQAKNGFDSDGVCNDATLGAMTRYWQSQRLGRSNVPQTDRLLSTPINEWYDVTRNPDLLQLERETYAAYKRMIAAAAKDLGGSIKFTATGDLAPGEKYLRIVSAFRSPEYQAALRRKEPGAGRIALAKSSPHFTGQAIDIYVGGEPVTTKDANRLIQVQTPAYRWLVKNAHRFGFVNYFYEPWHWEYVGVR
ncbi:MAG: D-alanyl-D-alanine carboxypeptidase family protein [Acidobacteria bacterium]|nr:D-alanyl-D-alanine carboxypeptidase family protein [Acidobacteriota bacterium]